MANEFSVLIKGKIQGTFKGEGGKRKDAITGLGFQFDVEAAHDAATGAPSGKRQYKPIKFVKEWGAATPQILSALSKNEILSEVTFEFFTTNAAGKEVPFETIKLTNAAIVGLHQYTSSPDGSGGHAPAGKHELEEVSIVFQMIEMTNTQQMTSASDDWER